MSVYLFPGQGSQSRGMGLELFHRFPELTADADNILGYSIQELCLEDPRQQLNQTQFTQPALYVINALSFFKKIQETGKKPHYVAGHSLGEFNALLAAEVFNFTTGLQLVKKRGELMSQASGGGMAAVIGLKAEALKNLLTQHGLTGVSLANMNTHTQIVISGLKEEVARAQTVCEKADARVIPLKVSGAFHSPLMSEAQNQFQAFLSQFKFSSPAIPVISNYTGQPYKDTEIYQNIIQQITHPVRWTEIIEFFIQKGETDLEEVGPGAVLTGLVRRIKMGQ